VTAVPPVVLVARNDKIAELVAQCAEGTLSFNELCRQVSEMGFRTTSLFEMVIAAEGVAR
jgi:hypothetical protein